MNWSGLSRGVKEGFQPLIRELSEEAAGNRALRLHKEGAKYDAMVRDKLDQASSKRARGNMDYASERQRKDERYKTYDQVNRLKHLFPEYSRFQTAAQAYLTGQPEDRITRYQQATLDNQRLNATKERGFNNYPADQTTLRDAYDAINSAFGKKVMIDGKEVQTQTNYTKLELGRDAANKILRKYGDALIEPFQNDELERVASLPDRVRRLVMAASRSNVGETVMQKRGLGGRIAYQGLSQGGKNQAVEIAGTFKEADSYMEYRRKLGLPPSQKPEEVKPKKTDDPLVGLKSIMGPPKGRGGRGN